MSCPTCKSDEPIYIEYREPNNKMAVQLLDIFTKIWCIDTQVKDDLAFMCKDCPFEVKDNGHCLVILSIKILVRWGIYNEVQSNRGRIR